MYKFNKTQVHRFPPKPYIKIDPAKLKARRDKNQEKKNKRKFRLLEVPEIVKIQVVTDTMLLKEIRRLIDGK